MKNLTSLSYIAFILLVLVSSLLASLLGINIHEILDLQQIINSAAIGAALQNTSL